ncbi:MAG TPA: insulinase family protein, partial [Mesotoga sp.]|nr:insulinase family protein [Mesotoga sp.]
MSILYKELSNNATLVGERKEETRTVSMAFAVKVGSADEDDPISGVSHFIEHTLFKGTKDRNAFEIKEPIERIGGSLNAYTGR